jgi:predicted site-specific integrase-resolvase
MSKPILGLADVARMFNVSRETARRWAVLKVVPAFKIHKKGRWQFLAEDVDKFLRARQAEGAPEQGQSAN